MTTADLKSCSSADSLLSFSIVVNTTDRAGSLRVLLRALEHQSYPHFEVVVVVGPTRDCTLEMLHEYDERVRILHCPEANLSRSRNIGLLAARGDIVAYIDDDAVPCRRWLEQLARLFQDPHLDATGGAVYVTHPRTPVTQHRLGLTSALAEQFNVRTSSLEHLVPEGEGRRWVMRMMGTNMAFRRQALLDVGGFDEFFVYVAEETDVALRMENAGFLVQPVKEAPVYHIPASSRNRVVFTNVGRWWLQTRSEFYFAVKNGSDSGERQLSILRQGLQKVHGHWLWYGRLQRDGQLSYPQMLWKCAEEVGAGLDAIVSGVFRPRRIIPTTEVAQAKQINEPILPFQNEHSSIQGTVDPISGRLPVISMPDEPLRICLTSGLYPPHHFDGVGYHTNLMARGLFELGHAVHVITRGEREQVAFYDGAYVHTIPYRLDRYPHYQNLPDLHHTLNYSHAVYEKARRMVMNDGIQLLDSPRWQVEGLVTAASHLLPVIVRLQTSMRQLTAIQRDRDEGKRLIGELEQALVERAAQVVPNSQATWDTVRQTYQIADGRQPKVVPHGIEPADESQIKPFPLQSPPDTLTVLYLGRLERRKGIQALFGAMPLVLEQMPNVRFLIAGRDNSQHDGFYRQTGRSYPDYFKALYPRFSERVRFLGQVSNEEKATLYQTCDLFVAPSLYESFGLIYLEAMNYAKPVVGCQAGGIPEVVDHGGTGLLVEPDAVEPLAEAIVSLLRSPVQLYEMGMAGRRRLLDSFTHIQMARGFEKLYREAIHTFASFASEPGAQS